MTAAPPKPFNPKVADRRKAEGLVGAVRRIDDYVAELNKKHDEKLARKEKERKAYLEQIEETARLYPEWFEGKKSFRVKPGGKGDWYNAGHRARVIAIFLPEKDARGNTRWQEYPIKHPRVRHYAGLTTPQLTALGLKYTLSDEFFCEKSIKQTDL